MVPIFALYPLPLMPRSSVAADDKRAVEEDFAAVLAVIGQEVQSPAPMVPFSVAPSAALLAPALAKPPVTGEEGGGSAPEADAWTDGAWPDLTADALTPDMLSAIMPAPELALNALTDNMQGQNVLASSAVVPPMQPSVAKATAPNPVLPSEPAKIQEWSIPPSGRVALDPVKRDMPQAGATTVVWASRAAMVDLGEQSPALASPEVSAWLPAAASASMTVTGMVIEAPHDAVAPSLPESAQAVVDVLSVVAPVSAKRAVMAAVSPISDVSVPTLPWSTAPLPKSPPSSGAAPMADFSPLPMDKPPVSQNPSGLREPKTALQTDLTALAISQNVQQTAPHFQPMREGAAILTTAVYAPPQMLPAEHLPLTPIWQTPPPTQRETAGPSESPLQTAIPIPAAGSGATAHGFVPPNPDISRGQGRRAASDGRETSIETYARPAETIVNLPSTTAETLRTFATGQTTLERPPLSESTAETRAILRQLTPATQNQDGAIEIALFPKGLGQVKLDIQHGPDGARIIVSADRPETLDLIRRHSADLIAEFRAAGMANPVVSFAPVDPAQPTQPPQRPDSAGLLAGGGFGGSSQHTGGSPQGQPSPWQDSPLGAEQPDLTPPPYRSDAVPRDGLILRL